MTSDKKVAQSCLTLCDLVDCAVYGIPQARILEWLALPFTRESSQPRDRTQVSHIAGGFFTSWATREAKNTGVGSLSLLQQIFPTQESNWGLLHSRQILEAPSQYNVLKKHIDFLKRSSDPSLTAPWTDVQETSRFLFLPGMHIIQKSTGLPSLTSVHRYSNDTL